MRRTVTVEGIELDVYFVYESEERRNWGHPDERLPDVPLSIYIEEARLTGSKIDIYDLLSEEVKNKVEYQLKKFIQGY